MTRWYASDGHMLDDDDVAAAVALAEAIERLPKDEALVITYHPSDGWWMRREKVGDKCDNPDWFLGGGLGATLPAAIDAALASRDPEAGK